MNKAILCIAIVALFFVFPAVSFSQTEVIYPSIPGIETPQEIADDGGLEEDVLPLFMAYIFRLLIIASLLTTLGVVIYGGVLHVFSGGDPEKRKEAKRWIVSAFQGAFIVLISHTLLYAIDSSFVIFEARKVEDARRIDKVDLEWTIKNVYFQIPLGLIAESAGVNENARDKIYDVLDATDEAERQADAIVAGGFQLLEIIEECPEGMECDCHEPFFYPYPIPYLPHMPHPRPQGGLIAPYDLDRSFSMEKPSGLQQSILVSALRRVEREMEKMEESEFKKESESIVARLKGLADARATTEQFRREREKVEGFLSKWNGKIQNFGIEKRKALKALLHALPKAHKGYDDTTYYAQFDPRWGDMLYGTRTFARSACYGASVAMVVDTLLGETVTPVDIRNISRPFILNGSVHGIVPNAANYYGLSYQKLDTMEQALATLDRGRMVIMTGGGMPHNMTRAGGHAYVLTGIDREKGVVYRSDPGHAYLRTLPIHEIKRSNADFAHTIYGGGGSQEDEGFFASVLNNLFGREFSAQGEKVLSFLSSLTGGVEPGEVSACCPDCPEISPAVQMKLAEIRFFMSLFRKSLLQMIDTKYPLEQDIYHLYKTTMIKSLGMENLLSYTTLLLDRRHKEREEVYLETYEETQEVGSHYYNLWYFWDWRQWLENITYKVRAGGEVREENDPLTFYLERPKNDDTIKGAKELARRENWQTRRSIPPYVWWYLDRRAEGPPIVCSECLYKREIPPYLWWYIVERPMSIGPDKGMYPPCPCPEIGPCPTRQRGAVIEKDGPLYPLYTVRQDIKELLGKLSEKTSIGEVMAATRNIPDDITPEEFEEMFDPEDFSRATGTPGDYLTCGMEIPVGETVELIREHLEKILVAVDDYLVEGVCFFELQEIMNRLAEPCSCPCTSCSGCDEDPPFCGICYLTCDKEAIYDAHEDVLIQRARLTMFRNRIASVTAGYFQNATENLCHRLNEDIKGEGEGCKNITMHELVARKLNYSRAKLSACGTRPEHLEDVLEGRRMGKMPLFGPIVEEKDIPRYTKTERGGASVNTSDLNWFCCSQLPDEEN